MRASGRRGVEAAAGFTAKCGAKTEDCRVQTRERRIAAAIEWTKDFEKGVLPACPSV